VGVLLYPNPRRPRAEVVAAAEAGLRRFNAGKPGGSKVQRALVLPDGPDAAHGEITDKGYIAQALARTLRREAVVRLFADPPPAEVMVF
jgi:feruloyl-CoA synthase